MLRIIWPHGIAWFLKGSSGADGLITAQDEDEDSFVLISHSDAIDQGGAERTEDRASDAEQQECGPSAAREHLLLSFCLAFCTRASFFFPSQRLVIWKELPALIVTVPRFKMLACVEANDSVF
jgi:hypothetical protein